jgi:LPS sulfotransferase NodH
MRPRTTFVVLTTQRSGSGWLVDLLDDHPAIAAYEELFRVTDTTVPSHGASRVPRFEVMVDPSTFSTSAGLLAKRCRYIRSLSRAHPEARAVGFKLMYDQTRDHPGLLPTLALMRARFVHLVRCDSLSAIVSFDIAHAHDRWHHHTDRRVWPPRVRVDTTRLLPRLQQRDEEIRRFRRLLSRLPVPVHEVVYEDLLARRDEVLDGVADFLGVPAAATPLRSTLVRPSAGRTVDLVENRDAVRSALAGTDYERLAA